MNQHTLKLFLWTFFSFFFFFNVNVQRGWPLAFNTSSSLLATRESTSAVKLAEISMSLTLLVGETWNWAIHTHVLFFYFSAADDRTHGTNGLLWMRDVYGTYRWSVDCGRGHQQSCYYPIRRHFLIFSYTKICRLLGSWGKRSSSRNDTANHSTCKYM